MQFYPLVGDYIKDNSSDWVSFQQDSLVKILYSPEEWFSLTHFITDFKPYIKEMTAFLFSFGWYLSFVATEMANTNSLLEKTILETWWISALLEILK